MSFLNSNIRYLRREQGLTQGDLAEKIGIKRSLVGAYEEHRAEPRIATIQKLSYFFQVPLDTLINTDLKEGGERPQVDTSGKTLRVLPIVVTPEDNELITVVPGNAEAGYADSYADPEYIETLPNFSLPVAELYPDQSYRLFQIKGDSMLPVTSGSYIICSYVDNWNEIKDGKCHIVVTRDRGVVYKRLWKRIDTRELLMQSDNPVYKPYSLEASEVREIWRALGCLSFDLPEPENAGVFDMQQIGVLLNQIHRDVQGLKHNIDNTYRD